MQMAIISLSFLSVFTNIKIKTMEKEYFINPVAMIVLLLLIIQLGI